MNKGEFTPTTRAFICNLCGKEMPLSEISTHQQMSHSEAFQTIQRAHQYWIRRFMTIFFPAVILMVAPLFILAFGVYVSRWYIIGGLWGLIASMPAGWWYAQRKTQREFAEQSLVLGNMPYQCLICEVMIPRKDVRAHLTTEHPREWRYFRISRVGSFWSLLGGFGVIYIIVSAGFLDLLPGVTVESLLIWTMSVLIAWIGFLVFWILLVDPSLKARARAGWRTTHLDTI